jgi:hypothetical protein
MWSDGGLGQYLATFRYFGTFPGNSRRTYTFSGLLRFTRNDRKDFRNVIAGIVSDEAILH